jgi:hypothetical protein
VRAPVAGEAVAVQVAQGALLLALGRARESGAGPGRAGTGAETGSGAAA